MIDPGGEPRKSLTALIGSLGPGRPLVVVEIADDGIHAHEVHRLGTGVPDGRVRSSGWPVPDAGAPLDREWVIDASRVRDAASVLLVRSAEPAAAPDAAVEYLREARPDAEVLRETGKDVAEELREAIADDPLTQAYELAVVRRHPSSGVLHLDSVPLFPEGSRRGATCPLTVWCEPAGDRGVVFAVLAVDLQERLPRRLSAHRARLRPGRYELTAVLDRPGRVRFEGLPVPLARYEWTGDQPTRRLPKRLCPAPRRARLVCAVEWTGPSGGGAERLDRVRQVIEAAEANPWPRPEVTVVLYGPHSFKRRWRPDVPVEVLVRDASPEVALDALTTTLDAERPVPPEHPRAAPVECALEAVESLLGPPDRDGTGVHDAVLLVGGKPPHPPRVDRSEILPCPMRADWEESLIRLERRPRTRIRAICDGSARTAHPGWVRLGGGELFGQQAVDVRALLAGLGLGPPPGYEIPFPLDEPP